MSKLVSAVCNGNFKFYFPDKTCQQTLLLQSNKMLLSCLISLNQGNEAKNLVL